MEELSREIVRYLRHNPTAPVNRNAYAPVEHILQHFPIDYYKLEAVIRQPSDKQRLFMSDCRQYVRAAAGHSIPIDLNLIGIPIKDPVLIGYCCHGTTVAAYEQIKREGLKTMNHQYVHFATERARLRHGSQVVITLNVKKYLQQGLKLFRLEDGNIAASGNSAGIIKPCFFKCIIDETNILQDGTLIDLCGAALLWRSAAGLIASPSEREFENMVDDLNAGMQLNTVSPFVKLKMGGELSLYVDNEHPTHCFSPCGHMASEKTVKYWSQVAVPHGCQGFHAICPFCATPLDEDPCIVKLIFQDYTD